MKYSVFGSDIRLENVCSRRNKKPGELGQALPTGLDGGLHGGDEVPNLEASPGHAQPPAGQPAADLETRRRGFACCHLAIALPLHLLHAGNPQ